LRSRATGASAGAALIEVTIDDYGAGVRVSAAGAIEAAASV
jgi:hypothetical protein